MYMKPNNAGKNMSLRAQTTNQKLNQNAQTQDIYGMQVFFVLFMTQLQALSQQYYY